MPSPPPSDGFVPTLDSPDYQRWMGEALDLAASAGARGEVPVGAVVVSASGIVIGRGANTRERDADPLGHAELTALRQAAGQSGGWRLVGCTLVVTLEPCVMCAGAIVAARIHTLVLGAWDPKAGACGSVWDLVRDRRANHWVQVVPGVRASESTRLLTDFFATRRL